MKRSVAGPYMVCTTGNKQKNSWNACTKDNVVATAADVPSPSKQGYFWPTMLADCIAYSLMCDKYSLRHIPRSSLGLPNYTSQINTRNTVLSRLLFRSSNPCQNHSTKRDKDRQSF